MTAFKYSAATLALLFASGMAYAQDSTTVQPQPGAEKKIECPAPGSVAEADLPMECKNKDSTSTSEMPKPADSTSGSAATGAPQADTAAGTATTTEVPKQYNATGTETTPESDPNATATTTTTEVPKQDNQATSTSATTTEGVTTGTAPAVNPATVVLASQFMGQIVYSAANENVGEINDLVMNKDLGNNIVAIIGVGGFLGIGEKDVAIPIDQITVVKDENNNMRLTIAASKEQLEAAPPFDRTALRY